MKFCKIRTCVRSTAIVAFAATAFSAQAATIETVTYSASATFGGSQSLTLNTNSSVSSTINTTSGNRDTLENVSIQKFDASLGTLTAVQVSYTVSSSASVGASLTCVDSGRFNDDCAGIDYGLTNGKVKTRLRFDDTYLSVIDNPLVNLSYDDNPSGNTVGLSQRFRSASNGGSATYRDADMLAFLTGSGTRLIDIFNIYSARLSLDCNATTTTRIEACRSTASVNSSGQVSISVRYTYEEPVVNAVPLPAGMPLLLAGLGGFAYLRRRR